MEYSICLVVSIVGNKSIYLNDDEEEWIENNVNNLSDYVRSHIRNDIKLNDRIEKNEKTKQNTTLLFYISFAFIGSSILVFSLMIHFSGFSQTITIDYGILMGLIAGIVLQVVSIRYMLPIFYRKVKIGGGDK
jgi:uncharacterized membrane-anchored protein